MTREAKNRFYRNKRQGVLFGVCAGIADYFDFNVVLVRIVFIICLIAFSVPTIIAYILISILVSDKPREISSDPKRDEFYRSVRVSPTTTLSEVKHRFQDLDRRLQSMERYVTSTEYQFDRDLNK